MLRAVWLRNWGLAAVCMVLLGGAVAARTALAGGTAGDLKEGQQAAPSSEPAQESQLSKAARKAIEDSPFFFELPARSGNRSKLNFADAVLEHNLVLYFWSASCPLCLLETRSVNRLAQWAEKHPSANLRVISINLDVMGPRALELGPVHPEIEFPVFYDPGGARTRKGYLLEESGLPAFYFFVKGGLPVQVVKGFDSNLVARAQESFLPTVMQKLH